MSRFLPRGPDGRGDHQGSPIFGMDHEGPHPGVVMKTINAPERERTQCNNGAIVDVGDRLLELLVLDLEAKGTHGRP